MNAGDICKSILSVFCVANICFLTACKDEDVVKSASGLVPFQPMAECEGNTRLNGTTWETGDQIGVFAYNNEGALVSDVNANVRFLVNPENNSCTVANADSTIWLSKGETYSVVAYYPYSTTDVQNIPVQVVDQPGGGTSYKPAYAINDWADQSDLTRLDLLWTSKSGITLHDADVSLTFTHQFSRVQINFTIDTEASSLTADSLAGMKVKLSGKNFPTLFDLKTGELSFGSMNQDSISFNVAHEEAAVTATAAAIVVPDADGSTSETRTITVLLPNDGNREFKFDVPSEIAFEAGKFYVWNVTFNTDATLSTNSFYVSASGNDSNSGKRNSPLATIAGAIAKMNNPDADYTIFIDGKVTGAQNIGSNFTLEKAKSVTIKGANGIDATTHMPKDTLDAAQSGSVVTIASEVPVSFQNIMLTNGKAEKGGGIYMSDQSYLQVTVAEGTFIVDNEASDHGGGIRFGGGKLLITGGKISLNKAEYGGGISVDGTYPVEFNIDGTVEISQNEATNNGGGIYFCGYTNQPFILSGNVSIADNKAGNEGGGILVYGIAPFEMRDNVQITGNSAGYAGGGVFIGDSDYWGGAYLYMLGGTISGNRITGDDMPGSGGSGIYINEYRSALCMGGSAIVTADNDVYLCGEYSNEDDIEVYDNAKIHILSKLTGEAPVATISLDEYVHNDSVVLCMGEYQGAAVTSTTVAENYQKFAIKGGKDIITSGGIIKREIDIDKICRDLRSKEESGTDKISGVMSNPETDIAKINEALKILAINRPDVLVKLDMSGVVGITEIGDDAFRELTALRGIVIPEGVTTILSYVFAGCTNLEECSLPSTLTYLEDCVFLNCTSLTEITIPSSVTTMTAEIFIGCSSLASVTLSEGMTEIWYWFDGCTSLTSLNIPSCVTYLSQSAFAGSGLTSCTIPSSITELPESLFAGCTSLEYVILPAGITSIGRYAFQNCPSFTTIYYMGSEADHDAITIEDETLLAGNVTWVYNYDPNAGGGAGAQGFVPVNGGTFPYDPYDDGSHFVGTLENNHTDTEIIIPDLLVGSQLVSQYEYEQLMTYYGVMNSVFGDYQPTETSEAEKRSTPAYNVCWMEAVIYCNLRSLAEGLTPVYSIQGETDPTATGSPWTEYYNVAKDANGKYYYNFFPLGESSSAYEATSGWDLDAGAFNYNLSANGYRLPTSTENIYIRQQNPDLITGSYSEWCQNYNGDYKRVWYDAEEQALSNEGMYAAFREFDIGFRIVRNADGN